jgi:hypothetical protein
MSRVVKGFVLVGFLLVFIAQPARAMANPELPRVYMVTAMSATPVTGHTIAVEAGGNLQDALDRAQPGDRITLPAGATYTGNFILPNKPGNRWITVRSDNSLVLPAEGSRMTPQQAGKLPKMISPNSRPAIAAAAGAHHWRLLGLEVSVIDTVVISYNLVELGTGLETSLDQLPEQIIVDRCYIHAPDNVHAKRGIQFNGKSLAAIDSTIAGIHGAGQDTQAILGWNGPGPFKILNNHLEAAGENVMFGGAPALISGLVPGDIEIRRNHFFKPLSWRQGHSSYAGRDWSVKNLFELKNAQRVLLEGNILENSWADEQGGPAIVLTVRGGTAMPWATVADVTIRNNIVRHVGAGFVLLKSDDSGPSGVATRIAIVNNLFEDISTAHGGTGWFLTNGLDNLIIDHNTIFQDSSIWTLTNERFVNNVFTNNIIARNAYGFHVSGLAEAGLFRVMPDFVLKNNVIVGGSPEIYPGNFTPANFQEIGFVDYRNGDGGNYRLVSQSPYRGAGASIDAIEASIGGTADIRSQPASVLSEGVDFTCANSLTVYRYSQAMRQAYPSADVFLLTHQSFAGVQHLESCPDIPDNGLVRLPEGTLVKVPASPTVYLIQAGQARPVSSLAALRRISTSPHITAISLDYLHTYSEGEDVI